MSKEKQIKKMAEAIFQNCNCGLFYSEAERIADFVINGQGYRKASDVAEEIFEEIKNINAHGDGYYEYWKDWLAKLSELEKKYTEGEK